MAVWRKFADINGFIAAKIAKKAFTQQKMSLHKTFFTFLTF